MQLIKDNLVVIIVAGAAFVLSIVFLAMGASASDDVESMFAPRQKAMQDIADQDKTIDKERVNENTVRVIKAYGDKLKEQAKLCSAACTDWNKRYFEKDILKIKNEKLKGGEIPAFPINTEEIGKWRLWGNFTESYIAAHNEMIAKAEALSPQLPTDADVEKEASYWEQVLIRNLMQEKLAKEPEKVPQVEPGESQKIKKDAREVAFNIVKKRKAQTGTLYVEKEAFQMIFPEAVYQKPVADDEMIKAQICLWVQKDILQVITDVNSAELAKYKEAFDQYNASLGQTGQDPLKACVIQSAVKRLVSMKLVNGNPAGSLAGYPNDMGRTVPIEIKLIMPFRNIGAFIDAMQTRNYYKVLKVSAVSVSVPADAKYTYGLEPVMEITFDAELLLLSDWESKLLAPIPTAAAPGKTPAKVPAAPAKKKK